MQYSDHDTKCIFTLLPSWGLTISDDQISPAQDVINHRVGVINIPKKEEAEGY